MTAGAGGDGDDFVTPSSKGAIPFLSAEKPVFN
jgi:hypothetical protein